MLTEILGPQDAPNYYADSVFGYCPSSLQGTTAGLQSGGDEWISYSHDTWASYVSEGFTEYIEVEIENAVYVQSITIGENRGMWAVVRIKAWDSSTSRWQTLYQGDADSGAWQIAKDTNRYNHFEPSICQTTFSTSVIRIEMNTYTIVDWNELDYVKIVGTTTLKTGVLATEGTTQTARVMYVPDSDFFGVDLFTFAGCDCPYDSGRISREEIVTVSVLPLNDYPVAHSSSIVAECAPRVADEITLQASDVDGINTSSTFTITSLPSNVALSDYTNELINSGRVPYSVPGATVSLLVDYAGADAPPSSFRFTFTATDEAGAVSTPIAITVTCSATQCEAGLYFDMTSLICADCPAGSFSSDVGVRSKCELCPVGTFNPQSGSRSCVVCSNGQVALERGGTSCVDCPFGTTCTTTTSLVVNHGMWRQESSPYSIYECRSVLHCHGGSNFGEGLCAMGYTGPLCSVCDDSYFYTRSGSEYECTRCDEGRTWYPTAVASFALMACTALVVGVCVKTRLRARLLRLHKRTKMKTMSLIHVCQVISQFTSISHETGDGRTYAEPAATFVRALSLFNFDLLSFLPLACSLPSSAFPPAFYTTLVRFFLSIDQPSQYSF